MGPSVGWLGDKAPVIRPGWVRLHSTCAKCTRCSEEVNFLKSQHGHDIFHASRELDNERENGLGIFSQEYKELYSDEDRLELLVKVTAEYNRKHSADIDQKELLN